MVEESKSADIDNISDSLTGNLVRSILIYDQREEEDLFNWNANDYGGDYVLNQ